MLGSHDAPTHHGPNFHIEFPEGAFLGISRHVSQQGRTSTRLAAQLGGPPPAPVPAAAPIRYRVMGAVPENWIPFIPVHVDGSNRDIQIQRARMAESKSAKHKVVMGDF